MKKGAGRKGISWAPGPGAGARGFGLESAAPRRPEMGVEGGGGGAGDG